MDGDQHLFSTITRPAFVADRGRGSWLWDEDGKRYLDLVQGWAVNSLGHAPAIITEVLADQAGKLLTPSPAFHNRPLLETAGKLAELTGLPRCFLCSTGAEANETAVKLARSWGRRHQGGAGGVITLEGAFHGRTMAMTAASGKPGWDVLFPPVPPGFKQVPPHVLGALAAATDDGTVAVMVEPVLGEGGVIPLDHGYLRDLRAHCDRHGLLLIIDEVQTGVGRCGTFLASEQAKVVPDILSLGKGLGAGFPVAACCCTEALDCPAGEQGGTYAGNPLAAAVAGAVLDAVAEPTFLARIRAAGERLRAGLSSLGSVRGRGLLLAVTAVDAPAVAEAARARGLLINAVRPDAVRLMPALTITDAEIDMALAQLGEVLP